MKDYTIADFLNRNAEAGNVSFHMPGHKGRSALYDEAGYGQLLRNAAAYDITEIPGADSLFSPRGALRNVMDNYAELYGARHTELLVNGSSAGLIAAILSSVPVGGKLILGRNSHHAAFSALRLGHQFKLHLLLVCHRDLIPRHAPELCRIGYPILLSQL